MTIVHNITALYAYFDGVSCQCFVAMTTSKAGYIVQLRVSTCPQTNILTIGKLPIDTCVACQINNFTYNILNRLGGKIYFSCTNVYKKVVIYV